MRKVARVRKLRGQEKIVGHSLVGQEVPRGHEEGAIDEHRVFHCPVWRAIRNKIRDGMRKWEKEATTSNKDCNVVSFRRKLWTKTICQQEGVSLCDIKFVSSYHTSDSH